MSSSAIACPPRASNVPPLATSRRIICSPFRTVDILDRQSANQDFSSLLRLKLPLVPVARRTLHGQEISMPSCYLEQRVKLRRDSPMSLLMQRPSRLGMGPLEPLGALLGNRHDSSPRSMRALFLALSRSRRFFRPDIFGGPFLRRVSKGRLAEQ